MLSEMPIFHGQTTKIVIFATATSLRSQHDPRVFATTLASSLRVYCAYTTSMEMLRRLSYDLHDPTALSLRFRSDRRTSAFVLNMLKTNAVTRRSSATMAITVRCLAFLPRFYYAYGVLVTLWDHFRSP